VPEDTKEQRADYVRGLLREKAGVGSRLAGAEDEESAAPLHEQIAAIDAELRRMGHEAKAPAKRAETREAKHPDGEKG
jgi:hypothetical protein